MSVLDYVMGQRSVDTSGGGGGSTGGLVVTVSSEGSTWTLDKTWQEIHDAIASGMPVIIHEPDNSPYQTESYVFAGRIFISSGVYEVVTSEENPYRYDAQSADGYPEMSFG